MRKCVYCLIDFNVEENNKEHILQNSLGSSLSSKSIVCSKCNQNYGRGCDIEIGKLADFLKFGTHAITDRNSGIKPLQNLKDDNGVDYSLTPDGKPILKKPYVREAGDNKIKVVCASPSQEKWAEHCLSSYLEDNGYDTNTIEKVSREEVDIKVGRLSGRYKFNFNKIAQGILKSAFNLIAHFHYDAALDDSFDELRAILMKDNLESDILNKFVRFPNFIPLPDDDFALFGHQFHIYSKGKHVEASVRLFGSVSFCLRLSDNYKGENINFTYRFDPERKANTANSSYIADSVDTERMFNFDKSFLYAVGDYYLKSFKLFLSWRALKVQYGNSVSCFPDILCQIKHELSEKNYIDFCEKILDNLTTVFKDTPVAPEGSNGRKS